MTYYVIDSSNSIHNTADDALNGNGLQLDAGESALITSDGYILATGAAGTGVYLDGYATGSKLTVNGYVYGTRDGIYSLGTNAEITVNGTVEGGASVSGGFLYISTSGQVSGGVSIQDSEFVNDGTLFGGYGLTGVQISSGSVVNNGLISSTFAGFFYDGDGAARVTNTGTIEGDFETFYDATATAQVTINNSGEWAGDIGLAPGDDTVTNTGTIDGYVYLGDGNNSLDSRYGLITGNVSGGAGTDIIQLGAGDTVISPGAGIDIIDGGAGTDTLSYQSSARGVSINLLTGYASGGDAQGDHFSNIEGVTGTLVKDVLVGDDGANTLSGVLGHDTITGNGGNDTIALYGGGSAAVIDGGSGNDFIDLNSIAPGTYGYAFTASTRVQGGTGYDTLELQRAPVMTFTSTTMLGIEHLLLDNGYDYDFTTVNATVASGARLLVDGSALTTGNYLHFNGAAETNGAFDFLGGDAQDVFAGGALADTFTGGWSGDTLTGGAGSDTFIYNGADESLFIHRDHITDFDASADHLQLDVDVAGINNAVSGAASTVTDIVNLANGHLTADHAMLVDVTSGALTGSTLLLIDANGTNGFQAASDYCIDVTGMTGTLNAADFIL